MIDRHVSEGCMIQIKTGTHGFYGSQCHYPGHRTLQGVYRLCAEQKVFTMSNIQPISKEDLIEQLETMKGKVLDPNEGLFGPSSQFWRIGRYSTAFLGAGRAALLQTAHPWVATAIAQHSKTMQDPMSRFRGTFTNVFTMVYGSLDQVIDSALRVHQYHARITGTIDEDSGAFSKGSCYQANEVQAMMWVHATLWETTVKMYELVIGPLSAAEKEAYYQETKLFAYLFGIPDEALPPNWNEFVQYNETMWYDDQLTVNSAAREIEHFLFHFNKVLTPALSHYRIITAMMMPEPLREQYGMPAPTAKNRALYDGYLSKIRKVFPYLPKHLRYLPPYNEALRRLNGKHSPGVVTGSLNKLMLGTFALVSH